MIRTLLAAALAAGTLGASGAHAQQNATFHQGCMMKADLAADLVKADDRLKGEANRGRAERSMRSFARAQERKMEEVLKAGYEKAAAFGWSKEKVDAEHEKLGEAVMANHIEPVRQKGRLIADVVMAVNTCAEGSPDDLGQKPEEIVQMLNTMFNWSRR
ncbi:hypothetical protein [Parvularcula maris]|uniref:Uncharacterized protein n=1 Tax=Parvularcula maris TaxID=2965077 RepID=A0A9X2L8Y6_9PROT|nr:hypothetical protein [Parvularcula maris]MCQ8185156.1 hypothetical protein [Parvularcula maris]